MNAIIIGSGISGLTLATQISVFFNRVIIIDSHTNELGQTFRKGVPQGNHLHVLLKKGQDILFDFFPYLKHEFSKECPMIDWSEDTKWENLTGMFPQYSSSIKTFSFTRGYLENKLFKAARGFKNINFITEKVTGYITKDNTVIGVRTNEKEYLSDKIFLCAGSSFPLARFLKDAGLESYKEDKRKIDITYSTSITSANEIKFKDFKQYYFQITPPFSNIGIVKSPVENEKLVSTKIEYKKNRKLKAGHPSFQLTKKFAYRRRMGIVPGLVILGDSLCSFNPVYGQGMTVAMMQVKEIVKNIRDNEIALQSKLFKLSFLPWHLSNMAFQINDNFINKYLIAFYKECQNNRKMHLKFINVLHMQSSVLEIFNINVLVKALVLKFKREAV